MIKQVIIPAPSNGLDVDGDVVYPYGLVFYEKNGTRLLIADFTDNAVHTYSLGEAWDVLTAVKDQSFKIESSEVINESTVITYDDRKPISVNLS